MDESDIAELQGLTSAQAAAHLARDGFNELPASKPRNLLAATASVIREPMFLLLLGAGAVYLLLGDAHEAAVLLSFVIVVIGITLYQERKTERVLDALRDLSSPRALVIRDGRQLRIPGREVVRDDLMIIAEGDRIAADAELLWSLSLSADESLLTGESAPVRKLSATTAPPPSRPGGDDLPYIYAGTLAVRGKGVAVVRATGQASEIGRIGKTLQAIRPEATPLQRETRRLVRLFAVVGLSLCVVAVVAYGLTRADWLSGILAGITMAMAILPEEFPVVLTVFLALGAWRISQRKVLTRRMPVVETLGATTVLCVDKTGTLTENCMTVRMLSVAGQDLDVTAATSSLAAAHAELLHTAVISSQHDPFDPMEQALRTLGARTGQSEPDPAWRLVREYPLSSELLALSHVWQVHASEYHVAAKGAPEAIADLCHLAEREATQLSREIARLADQGLRVIGVAKATTRRESLPAQQHDFDFRFLGLIGLADPVRPEVPAAVAACAGAGIRVVMMTGDYPGTASSVAREIGLPAGDIITGPELDSLNDAELRKRINDTSIFARIVPEQKLRLVQALKANGEIVAMTGDGVNDAPALQSAHVGVAMGGRGTDVAREAAAMVILDDNFASIVAAIHLGRRVADNLRKAMAYILAVHLPIIGLSLLPVLFGWPLILAPVHIVFLQLIIDPACSIVFEAEPADPNLMRQRPRDPRLPLFDRTTITLCTLQGAGVLVIMLVIFVATLYRGAGDEEARALTFTALVVANLGLIFANRSWSRSALTMLRTPNQALWWVVGGTAIFLSLILSMPTLRDLFRFGVLHAADIAFCLAAGVSGILWFEAYKRLRRRPAW